MQLLAQLQNTNLAKLILNILSFLKKKDKTLKWA